MIAMMLVGFMIWPTQIKKIQALSFLLIIMINHSVVKMRSLQRTEPERFKFWTRINKLTGFSYGYTHLQY